jgi:hypothetical protein
MDILDKVNRNLAALDDTAFSRYTVPQSWGAISMNFEGSLHLIDLN